MMRVSRPRPVELLAPAAGLNEACAAVDAGADAVYMGGPAFGARSRAGNSMADVEKAVKYAHLYHAKCYLTLNTLIYENEMEQAVRIARQAYDAGVDALIVQDMGLLEAGLPPIELHASTQCHIVTPEKALFLEKAGFRRLVLGRELSLREIKEIASCVRAEIETFVHGALCVSYSGRCYMSCHMNGRSGNRGECAQSCRLPYRLENAAGKVLQQDRYLLSMKDFHAYARLEELVEAGVCSFKIEGRLKDAVYVKNITAYYRKKIDALQEKGLVCPASKGRIYTDMRPDAEKTYHREYTDFNLDGKRADWAVFGTPKATGERIGRLEAVKEYTPGRYSGLCIEVKTDQATTVFESGDGLCYYDTEGILQGGNIEKALRQASSWLIYLQGPGRASMLPPIGCLLYRNRNAAFEKAWGTASVVRKIPVRIVVDTDRLKVCVSWDECPSETVRGTLECAIDPTRVQEARDAGNADAMLLRQLEKLGGTAYVAGELRCEGKRKIFVPASVLNECRRRLVEGLDEIREKSYTRRPVEPIRPTAHPYPGLQHGFLDYTANVANHWAANFYKRHGATQIQPAFEVRTVQERREKGQLLMVCKHCIRYQLGQCLRQKPAPDYAGDLYLCYGENKFALHFDCANCRMEVRSGEV